MAGVKWIMLDVEMFNNRKIMRLRRLPDGNNLILIWVMLLTMAGRCNAGGMIMITQNVPYTAEDLADELDFSLDTIKLALKVFEDLGMISSATGIEISNWEYYQNEAALTAIREAERARKAEYREKKKIEKVSRTSPGQVPELSISISNNKSIPSSPFKDSITNIVNYLNLVLGSNYKPSSKNTVKYITSRLNEGYTEDDFYTVIDKMNKKWGSDPKMSAYLRPETLFGNKFESYLNMPAVKTEMDEWENESSSGLFDF